MILHCTKALAAKLPDMPPAPPQETSPLGSWHAHLYTIDRRQCVFFCHDETRYILFQAGLRKEQFATIATIHKELYLAALIAQGVPETTLKKVSLALGPVTIDTITDRSVLGTLKQSRSDFDSFLEEYGNVINIPPLEAMIWLNHRPLTARGKWLWSDKAMLELIEKL